MRGCDEHVPGDAGALVAELPACGLAAVFAGYSYASADMCFALHHERDERDGPERVRSLQDLRFVRQKRRTDGFSLA